MIHFIRYTEVRVVKSGKTLPANVPCLYTRQTIGPIRLTCAYTNVLSSTGVSLHYSSSGLDLPMKVVDMFGAGLPVMALGYGALKELVKHDENGIVFHTKEELANLLQDWFRGFPKETEHKQRYYDFRKNIDVYRKINWHSSWKENALPVFRNESKKTL